MIQLRLTGKVQKAIGVKPDELIPPIESPNVLGHWTVNLFKEDRRNVLIFVNEKTLYNFIIYGLKKKDYIELPNIFINGLAQLLESDGFSRPEIKYLLAGTEEIRFCKTQSKKVLGNVNDLVNHYKYSIGDDGGFEYTDVGEIIHNLNRMPQRNIGWGYSIEAVKEIAKSAS